MTEIRTKVLRAIEQLRVGGRITGVRGILTSVSSISFNHEIGPKDDKVTKVGVDTIYFEEIDGVNHVIAEYNCRAATKETEESTSFHESVYRGSFSGDYIIEDARFNLESCHASLSK
jgi:hypothetical protein